MDAANFKIRVDLYDIGEYVNNQAKISITRVLVNVENIPLIEMLIDMYYTTLYTYTTEEKSYISDVLNQLIKDDKNFYQFKKQSIVYGHA